MKHILHFILTFILIIGCFASCEKQPDGLLSKGKMEDVLFDYHIAQGLANFASESEHDYVYKYVEAVYEKHGITEAQFDSSLIYYNRHIEELQDIYKHVQARLKSYDETLRLQSGNNEMRATYTLGGDTADIWSGKKLIVLHNNQFFNKETFTLKADTSFHLNDQFKLSVEFDFIREDQSNLNNNITASLILKYKDGKNVGTVRQSNYPGKFEMSISAYDDREIESISGYFYLMSEKTQMRMLGIVRNISLYRYHTTQISQQDDTTDSIASDSIDVDSVKVDSASFKSKKELKRMSPEELRKLSTDDKPDLEIRKAPEVRTRNSIGPRRRINNRKK